MPPHKFMLVLAIGLAMQGCVMGNSGLPKPWLDRAPAQGWPLVRPKTESFDLNLQHQYGRIRMNIDDTKGYGLYTIECYFGDDGGYIDIDSGGLLCGMNRFGKSGEYIYDSSFFSTPDYGYRAIYSRANFNPQELYGACADHPEYGRRRVFLFRGMRIVFFAQQISFAEGYHGGEFDADVITHDARAHYPIGSMQLQISVAPSANALSNMAQPDRLRHFRYPQDCAHQAELGWPPIQQ